MGVKQIHRVELLGLPNSTIDLINRHMYSLWEIEPKTLSNNTQAKYLLHQGKDNYRYLTSIDSPLPIRPETEEIGKLKIIHSIKFDGYKDPWEQNPIFSFFQGFTKGT